MIATPPPAELQFITVSALLFAPAEGVSVRRLKNSSSGLIDSFFINRTPEDYYCELSTVTKGFPRQLPDSNP